MHDAPTLRPLLSLTKAKFLKELGDAFDEAAEHGFDDFAPYMLFQARGLVVSHVERLRREAEKPVEPPPHEVLGLEPNATTRQIEDAWGIFARKHASDRGAGQELFYRGYKAYRALIDAKLKQAG